MLVRNLGDSMGEIRSIENDIYAEYCECIRIAQRLDAGNPELPGAFVGTASERIWRQLAAMNLPLFSKPKEPK